MDGTAGRRTTTPADERSAGLIGRDAELARLEGALAAGCAGRSTVVAVVGAYGSGKSALLGAVRTEAERTESVERTEGTEHVDGKSGARVLATQGRTADAQLDFAALSTLLRPVGGTDLDRWAGDLAEELRAALSLGRRAVDAAAVRVATLRVLHELAAERPLVLLVDDAHLLDRASAEALAFATGRLSADPVLTVLATQQYAPTVFDELGPETIVLGSLGPAEIGRILDRTVPLAAEPRHRCVELAEGNPLAALELAASLDARQRGGEVPLPAIPRLSGLIGSAFALRISMLGAPARTALAVVAADDTGELAVVVDALVGLDASAGGLAEAEAAGLLAATGGGTVRFTHPLIRPVAYHQVDAAGRREAHRCLAAALRGPHQGASRAWQLVAAAEGPDAALAEALAEEAGEIARRGRPAAAARTLECAAALAACVERRRDLLVAATSTWLDAGIAQSATRVADTVAGLPATAESVAVVAAAFRGNRPAAQVLAFVGAAVTAVDPAERDATTAVLADEMLAAGVVDDAVALARTLVPTEGDDGGAAHLAAAVLVTAGHVDGQDGPIDLQVESAGAATARARTLVTAAAVDAGMCLPASAVGRPLVAAGGTGLDSAVSRARSALATGAVAEAHDQLLRLDALVPVDDRSAGRAGLDLALADAELLVGRAGDARRRAGTVATWAGELGLGWLRGRADWMLGRLALAAGDHEAALVPLRSACRVVPHLAAADLVEACAMADRPTEAQRARLLVRRLIGARGPILDIRARRAAGTLGSQAELDTALCRAEIAGLPLEAAAVVVTRAETAWRSGDLDAAASAVDDARNRFQACGVAGWSAARLDRLVRRDEPEPVVGPTVAGLSPAEYRVALAVADGCTNQQAAAALHLSVKTIDFHLQNIYRKLGLRSRTELAVVVHHGSVPERVAS